MERWPEKVYEYIVELTRFEDLQLLAMEERAKQVDFPGIGPQIGPWLYFFARLIKARRIYELGAGYGYSTYYFASALRDNGGGTVTHTVWDDELSQEAREWMRNAGLLRYCAFEVSESVLALSSAEPGLDIVFMDIDKEGYPAALSVIENKLRPGGLLLTDNVLWDGRAVEEDCTDLACTAIKRFNQLLYESERWEYVINPLRDGLGISRLVK